MTEIIQPRDTVRLRPIGALDPATTSSDADLLLVEQAGTARKITRGDLLEDTETALLAYIDDNALSTSVDNTFTGDNTFSAPVSLTSAGAGAIIQPIPSEPGRLSFARSGFVRFSIEHSVAGNLDFRYADGAGDYLGTPFSISGSGALTLLGTPTAPTASPLTSTTQLATTAFTTLAVGVATTAFTDADALKADLASPALTGNPTAPTQTAGNDTTRLATTAFVTTADNLKANLASPTFTGVPAGPTAAVNTNTTQFATTAFVRRDFVRPYTESAETTWAASSTVTIAHGLGYTPIDWCVVYRCIIAEDGYAVGDEINADAWSWTGTSPVSGSVAVDATNVVLTISANPRILSKTTRTGVTQAVANWRVVAYYR